MLKDACTSISFQTVKRKVSENIFPTHAGKLFLLWHPFYTASLLRPIPEDIKTHITSLSHSLNTPLLFPLSFRVSTNFPLPCTLLFSIFTTFPYFLGSPLTKTNTITHVQHVLASLFSTVLHFWHSAVYSHCTTEIALVTSPSLNDVVFIYIFTDPCRLLL